MAPKFGPFDNDFPYDPNAVPTEEDYDSWNEWGRNSFLAHLVPGWFDSAFMYSHYRKASGTDVEINYRDMYNQEPVIREYIDKEIEDMMQFAQKFYLQTNKISFEIIGDIVSIPNGKKVNVQRTIGAHQVYAHGVVTYYESTQMFVMTVTLYMEDMYNFNRGQNDIQSGTPDAVNGRFSTLGWAKEFKVKGTMTTLVTWKATREDMLKDATNIDSKGR